MKKRHISETKIADLQDDRYELITNSQDIESILNDIGLSDQIGEWGCLFVEYSDGEYNQVWGSTSNIPHLSNNAYQLYPADDHMSEGINLLENYERFFGKITSNDRSGRLLTESTKPTTKSKITESQMARWTQLHNTFSIQYPRRTLIMREGKIWLDGHFVENSAKFLDRKVGSMIEVLKATHQKLNGLGS